MKLKTIMKKIVSFSKAIVIAFFVLAAALLTANVHAQKYQGKYFNNLNNDGVIIDGYDPVAFFTNNKPVKGDARFQYTYEDAIYYFASQEHLDLFKKILKSTKCNLEAGVRMPFL